MKWFGKPQREKFAADWQARLDAWQALPEPSLLQNFSQARYVVVDVESSGLDAQRDQLISIGAVAIDQGEIQPQDFDVVLRQENASSVDNILIHRIGGTAQQAGLAPHEALLCFLEFAGKAPLVAYHAAFDRTLITRALREAIDALLPNAWLDLAWVLPELHEETHQKSSGLDGWLARHHITHVERHHALSDAYATAQLCLIAMNKAEQKNFYCMQNLLDMQAAQQWLSRTKSSI
jgi:DNA polymerase III subunit epsilon